MRACLTHASTCGPLQILPCMQDSPHNAPNTNDGSVLIPAPQAQHLPSSHAASSRIGLDREFLDLYREDGPRRAGHARPIALRASLAHPRPPNGAPASTAPDCEVHGLWPVLLLLRERTMPTSTSQPPRARRPPAARFMPLPSASALPASKERIQVAGVIRSGRIKPHLQQAPHAHRATFNYCRAQVTCQSLQRRPPQRHCQNILCMCL